MINKWIFNSCMCMGMVLMMSCHAAKKIQTAGENPQTAAKAVAPPAKKVDTALWARSVLDSSAGRIPLYKTFTAKLGVSYESTAFSQDVNASVRIRKDSLIWVSVTGPFGIEGVRVLISPDSVILLNKLNKTVERKSISYLQYIAHVPLGYQDIQSLLTGGPVLYQGKMEGYKRNDNGQWLIDILSGIVRNNITLDGMNHVVLNNHLTDSQHEERTCDIRLGAFAPVNGYSFPKEINIAVQDKAKIGIGLQYKQVNFDQPVDFPFAIPGNYRIRS